MLMSNYWPAPLPLNEKKRILQEEYLIRKQVLVERAHKKRALNDHYQSLPDTGGPEDWLKILYSYDADAEFEIEWKELKDEIRSRLSIEEHIHNRVYEQEMQEWECRQMIQEDLTLQDPIRKNRILESRLLEMIE